MPTDEFRQLIYPPPRNIILHQPIHAQFDSLVGIRLLDRTLVVDLPNDLTGPRETLGLRTHSNNRNECAVSSSPCRLFFFVNVFIARQCVKRETGKRQSEGMERKRRITSSTANKREESKEVIGSAHRIERGGFGCARPPICFASSPIDNVIINVSISKKEKTGARFFFKFLTRSAAS